MRICYLDESGTPELTEGTSHFILLGLSIAGESWKSKDNEITVIKRRFGLAGAEIHSGWLSRRYPEQERIPDFETLGLAQRRAAVQEARDEFLIRKAALKGPASVQEDRKNFRKTTPYIHLPLAERRERSGRSHRPFVPGTTAISSLNARTSGVLEVGLPGLLLSRRDSLRLSLVFTDSLRIKDPPDMDFWCKTTTRAWPAASQTSCESSMNEARAGQRKSDCSWRPRFSWTAS